jgi:putative Ca2+/H+ antiporter (TMEM165/GDT1 family)
MMDFKLLIQTFLLIFLAELGDKSQLVTIALVTKNNATLTIFLGAATALVLVTLIAIFTGKLISQYIPTLYMNKIIALVFIIIGVLLFFNKA